MTDREFFDSWAASVGRECDRRQALLKARADAGGEICQDDYEWATMVGEYTTDGDRFWHVESDGHVWSERAI